MRWAGRRLPAAAGAELRPEARRAHLKLAEEPQLLQAQPDGATEMAEHSVPLRAALQTQEAERQAAHIGEPPMLVVAAAPRSRAAAGRGAYRSPSPLH